MTPEKAAAWSKGTVEDWATESLADARLAYRLPGSNEFIKRGARLGKGYASSRYPSFNGDWRRQE